MTSHLSDMPRIFETTDNTALVIIVDLNHEEMVMDITIHAPGNIPNKDIARVFRESAAALERGDVDSEMDMREVQDP